MQEWQAALFAKLGVLDGDEDMLQWSVVYDLSSLQGRIFAHRNTGNQIAFSLE